jgi:hypothetical protein
VHRVNRRGFARAIGALLAAGGAALPGVARGEPLTPTEREALGRGETVRRPVDVDLEEGTYIGGVSYAIVEAPVGFVLALLHQVPVYRSILALTLEANDAGKKGGDQLVYFKHGGRLGTAGYTMRIQKADSGGVIRFWMDRSFDHEIDDVWGFVRVEEMGPGRCLATYAVLCDLGTMIRLLFGERIRAYALDTPGNIKRVAESDWAVALHVSDR